MASLLVISHNSIPNSNLNQSFNLYYIAINLGVFISAISCSALTSYKNIFCFYTSTIASLCIIVFLLVKKSSFYNPTLYSRFCQQHNSFIIKRLFLLIFLTICLLWLFSIKPGLSFLCMILCVCIAFLSNIKKANLKIFNTLLLLTPIILLYACYEQGASSINIFIDTNVNKKISIFSEITIPTITFQALDPLMSIIIGSLIHYHFYDKKK